MTPKEAAHGDENIAYFVSQKNKNLLRRFDEEFQPLLECDAIRCDEKGDLHIVTYYDLAKETALRNGYVEIAPPYTRRDVFAPTSHVLYFKEERFKHIKTGVEGAIRMTDEVITREIDRETPQMQEMGMRALELLTTLREHYETITYQEFQYMLADTDKLLQRIHLNPKRLFKIEKLHSANWLRKGSLGLDSSGNMNKMVILKALGAVVRRAAEQQFGIDETITKYLWIRETCIFARELYRNIFRDVFEYTKPLGMRSHVIFQYPLRRSGNVETLLRILKTKQSQLLEIQANPYFQASREARTYLALIEQYLQNGQPQEVIQNDLFAKAHAPIAEALVKHAKIYPEEKH